MMYNVPGMMEDKAYDIVRREFYALRQEEDVERRVAKEEAMKVGAYFGKSYLQVGMELEDKEFERWKNWAGKNITDLQAEKDAAYMNFGDVEEEGGLDTDTPAETEATSSPDTTGTP